MEHGRNPVQPVACGTCPLVTDQHARAAKRGGGGHRRLVGDVVAIIDARLPGSYEENVAGINIGLVRALGTPNPVTTSIVSGPDAPRPAPAVRSVGQSMGRIDDLYENGNDSAHIQVQRVVDPATGQGRWIAMIPGTATFSWNARTPLDGSGNVAAAAGLVRPGSSGRAAGWPTTPC